VAEAEPRAQAARAAVDRAERLIADRAVSQRALDDARRELAVAETAVQSARRAAQLFSGAVSGRGAGVYRITAPISGVITDVRATAGKTVAAGELLVRVIDLSELWIRARVPEHDAGRLRADEDAAYQLTGSDAWLPIAVTAAADASEKNAASVVSVGRVVDARSRTVDVIYALAHPDERLRVGALVRVSVPAGQPFTGVIVPRDAVLEHEGGALVYVQVEGEAFEERAVRLGAISGDRIAIEHGVTAGERVVTRGANIIRLSARARSAPAHGHVH
jgi:membrane fusion protein, heavy metal efflux system